MSSDDKKNIDSYDYQAPNGESWVDVRKRAESFFKELNNGVSLNFTHGGLICSQTHPQGLEDIVTNGSVIGLRLNNNGEASEIILDWEYPLEENI